jgi:hypothetical protein
VDRNLLFQPHPEVVADDHGIQPKRFTQGFIAQMAAM